MCVHGGKQAVVPKGTGTPIPGTCENVTLQERRKVPPENNITDLRMGWVPCNEEPLKSEEEGRIEGQRTRFYQDSMNESCMNSILYEQDTIWGCWLWKWKKAFSWGMMVAVALSWQPAT